MRVLIVDDEVNLRFAIERRLRKAGMETGSASTVRHAIDRLRNEAYDVVLCDLRMPGGNGTQLLQWLGSYSPSTMIIVVSAFVTPEFRKTYQPTGRLRILEKPVDLDVLVETLEELGPRKGFYGNAIEVELFDYVQMIALSGRDKLVEVTTPTGKGLIWFEHGDIVHVEYDQYRGEMAFYTLLGVNRGTFKEVFNREPPMRTVVRSSTHLLMEAARRADEGTLHGPPAEEEDEETSFGDVAAEVAAEDEPTDLIENAEDVFAEPEAAEEEEYDPDLEFERAMALTDPSRELTFHSDSPAGLPVVDDDDLVDPFAEPEAGPVRVPTGPNAVIPPEPGALEAPRPEPPADMLDALIDDEEQAVLDSLAEGEDEEYEEELLVEEVVEHEEHVEPEEHDEPEEHVEPEEHGEHEEHEEAEEEEAEESSSGGGGLLGHAAMFEDPDMRAVMLEQFWQFDGINGVAIISSTGKVLAEDMRNNSSLVTLAGFYMRGAARIARTLGFNVFDGVVARSIAGQQMVMVSMGAASAVLSVEPGTDPEMVRDQVMGVE